jgi:alpha-beta hydrolase superfamily lysophospholipase
MEHRDRPGSAVRWRRWLVRVAALVALLLSVQVLRVRRMPELEPWHSVVLEAELEAEDFGPGFTFADYLAREERLFAELDERVCRPGTDRPDRAWSRYAPGGLNNPLTFPFNWNRTFELRPEAPRGVALLLHGLTDSPYSLRRTGEVLAARGMAVVGLRLPGHGTVPAALDRATRDDWLAAVRLAARHCRDLAPEPSPFLVVGYSNGAALATVYTLEAVEGGGLPVPDRLVLLSPAIGVTAIARFAAWHRCVSFMPFFEGLKWQDVDLEYDPYKYNSFPKNAAYQTYRLTRSLQDGVERLQRAGRAASLPPVLTFLSVADATVRVEDVVSALHARLAAPGHELVVFDINRLARMAPFFAVDPAQRLRQLVVGSDRPYRLTVVTNAAPDSTEVAEVVRDPGAAEPLRIRPLGLRWPDGVYSLSHVALPFPADDWVYGRPPAGAVGHGVQLGLVEARGERALLKVPAAQLLRLRANPFFGYVEERLVEVVDDLTGAR